MLLDVVDALNENAVALHENLNNTTLLATVSAASLATTSENLNQVSLFDVCHD
jgi:hypothetical protein